MEFQGSVFFSETLRRQYPPRAGLGKANANPANTQMLFYLVDQYIYYKEVMSILLDLKTCVGMILTEKILPYI